MHFDKRITYFSIRNMFASNFHRKNNRRLLSRPLCQEGVSHSRSAPQPQNGEPNRTSHDNFITKRVLSAKEHRLKQAQDQLSVAHNHIRELNNENRILRNMQKRMEFALERYEGSEADIPKLLHSHQEDIRLWRMKQSRLREQLKETSQRLKNKEQEYNKLHSEHKRLVDLTKNMNLGEREKLQIEIDQLNERLKKSNETINLLQKKLLLKNKSHKYRLQTEILKHKETQNQLKDAISNYEKLTEILLKKDKISASTSSWKIPRPTKKVEKTHQFSNDTFKNNALISEEKLTNTVQKELFQLPSSSDIVTTTNDNRSKKKHTIIQNAYSSNSLDLDDKSSTEDEFYLISHERNQIETEHIANSVNSDLSINLKKTTNLNLATQVASESPDLFAAETQLNINDKYNPSEVNHERSISTSKTSSLASFEKNEINSLETNFKNQLKINSKENLEIFNALEAKSTREQSLLDDIINNYCNDVLQTVNKDMINIQNKVEPNTVANKVTKKAERPFPEENNNSASTIKKLDEEKKQKLLATLKAIDAGEIDGLAIKSNLNNRRKSKPDNLLK